MSTYKQIAGTTVKAYTTNPSDPQEGEMWYNQTTLKLRGVTALAAFSSSGSLITAKGGTGNFGIQTAAVSTAGGALPAKRHSAMSAGTQTAGLYAFGRDQTTPTYFTTSFEYDGSSWTAGNSGNTARAYLGGFGVQTSAVACGGFVPPNSNATEEYDGTNWTASGNMGTARYQFLTTAGVSSASGIATGGREPPGASSKTESYDGSTWSTSPATLANARHSGGYGPTGTSTAAVAFGGNDGTAFVASTEEYNFSAQVVTAGAWASGGALPTALRGLGGFGTQTAAISAGGLPPGSGTTSAFSYDGSTWTGIPAIGAANSFMTGSRLSPGSAGSVYGGEPVSSTHQYWDGSSWSEQTDMNSPRYAGGGAGTQTSSLMMGGIPGAPGNTATEEWDGSAWTNQNNAPHGIYNSPGSGSQTAALIFGGNNPTVNTTAEYDGTNWTTSGSMITSRASMGGGGTQTDTIIFGGATSPPTTATSESEGYDGTSWSTRPSLGTARRALGSAGHTPTALAFGGTTGSDSTATEEFTPESTSVNTVDITTAE